MTLIGCGSSGSRNSQTPSKSVQIVKELPEDKVCVNVAAGALQAEGVDYPSALDQLKLQVASLDGNTLIVDKEIVDKKREQTLPVAFKLEGRGYNCELR